MSSKAVVEPKPFLHFMIQSSFRFAKFAMILRQNYFLSRSRINHNSKSSLRWMDPYHVGLIFLISLVFFIWYYVGSKVGLPQDGDKSKEDDNDFSKMIKLFSLVIKLLVGT